MQPEIKILIYAVNKIIKYWQGILDYHLRKPADTRYEKDAQ